MKSEESTPAAAAGVIPSGSTKTDGRQGAMPTQISPMLAVSDGNTAIEFYKAAFGATVLWRLGGGHVVAGLEIDGAPFFLAQSRRRTARARRTRPASRR